jgi:hypothetical protein
MSLVSTRLALKHLCTVERDATSTTNGWGTKAAPNWQPNATNVPCKFWATAGREDVDGDTFAAVEDLRLIVPADTDVTERDRIGDVTDRGAVALAGPTSIRAILRRADHLELVLVRIS